MTALPDANCAAGPVNFEMSQSMVVRTRLVELIGRPPRTPITLITAPAGYGKSTLIAQWIAQAAHRVAWVPLTRAANTVSSTLTAIIRALTGRPAPVDASAVTFDLLLATLRDLTRDDAQVTLVLDDLQQIENREVIDALSALVASMPDRVSVILASRHQVPLALARLRAAGMVRQLTARDLVFTSAEVAAVAQIATPTPLTAEQVTHLHARTTGWIAGIRLALQSLDHVRPEDVDSVVDTWTASRWLDDYIVEEVLTRLPSAVRAFVEETVFLPELTPAMCDLVRERSDSAAMLAIVSEQLVFVRSQGEALVYHALFAESVTRISARTGTAGNLAERQLRAAQAYAARGQHEQAIELATVAEAWELAEQELVILGQGFFNRGGARSLVYWIGKLPEERILAYPKLAHWYMVSLRGLGLVREANDLLGKLEPQWIASGDPLLRAYVRSSQASAAAMAGDVSLSLRSAYEALACYSIDMRVDRLRTWATVVQMAFLIGEDDIAQGAYQQAAESRRHLPEEQWTWHTYIEPERANQHALRGDLSAAIELYEYQLRSFSSIYRFSRGRSEYRVGSIALEQGRIDDAEAIMEYVCNSMESYFLWHIEALLARARVHEAKGEVEQVEVLLQRSRKLYEEHGGDHNLHRIEAVEVDLWLATGRDGLVEHWMEQLPSGAPAPQGPRILGDPDPRLSWIRGQLMLGNREQAAAYLEPLLAHAIAMRRAEEIITLSMWQVVISLDRGDRATAETAFTRALLCGKPGGFVRSFRTPGHPIEPFVCDMRDMLPDDLAAYVTMLVGHGVWDLGDERPVPEQDLLPRLTPREVEVLSLLPLGVNSRLLGERLFISERTVKKHVANILEKLGVNSRIAAVQRARELGLLQPTD